MKSTKWPVAALLFLSPLIGEYLLGSLPVSMIALLPLMMAMYGAAAILIREVVRRTGGGWASIVLLATAYGLFEEGFVTQSLFNPNYLHLRLLDFGFTPLLGTALPWALFVVGIHVVWSITVPIALTESAFPERRDEPWLGTTGRVVYALTFVAGCTLIAVFTYKQTPFMATPAQFGVVGALIVALCITALKLPRHKAEPATSQPNIALLFLVSFVAGSLFMLSRSKNEHLWQLSPALVVMLLVGTAALFAAFVFAQSRNGGWDERRRFALMAGAFMVYVWIGFATDIALHGNSDLAAHSVLAVLMCALLMVVGLRANRGFRPYI